MNKKKQILPSSFRRFLLLLLFTCIPLRAEGLDLGIEFSVIGEGIVSGGFAILQDSSGFMWFGSQMELTRFDGFDYKTYMNVPFDENSISGNAVYSLLEDSFGNFWVGTAEDLCLFDREKEIFTHYIHNPEDSLSLPSGGVFSLFEDSLGVLWIGTNSGFCVYDRENNTFDLVLPDSGTVSGFNAENYPVYEEISGTIWFGTSQGLYRLSGRENFHFEHFTHDPDDPFSLGADEVTSITGDQSGNLWIGTWGNGVNRLDTKTMTFTSHIPDPEYLDGVDTTYITSIISNADGSIFIGVNDAGVVRYDPGEDSFIPLIYGQKDVRVNRTVSLYRDKSGVHWIGIHGFGIVRYDPGVRTFSSVNFNEWVLGFAEDDNGLIWISGDINGLYTFDRETEILTTLGDLPGASEVFSSQSYNVITDSSGYVWNSTATNGLHKIDPETLEIVESFYHDPENENSLSSNGIADIYEGSGGEIWITTVADGLNKYYPETREFISFRNDPDNPSSLANDELWCVLEDSRGNLWLGTTTSLERLDKGRDEFLHFTHDPDTPGSISNDWVLSILEDSSGYIWFATWGGGINKYDYETDLFTYYMKADGLSGNVAADILEDNSGNIWIGTIDGGVSKFNPETEIFVNYSTEDGFLGGSNGSRSELTSRDGTLFMSSGPGFIYFNPQEITADSHNPKVVLTSLKVFEEEKNFKKLINYYKEIDLSYREDFFSFGFSALEFAKPDKLQFAYKLEGWDEDWNYCGSRRFAAYTNIPGGSYTFLVKSTNSDGAWVPEDKYASLQINISTHPLKTWWAISSYVLIGLAAVLVAFLRYRSVQKQKLIRERLISDRLLKVDNLKDQFLANTTHELRTPLNGIIGLAESLIDNPGQEVSEGTKKELSLIASSGRRLSFLINDILDLSRLKEGDISLNRGPVNLARLVNTVLVLSKPLLAGKDVRLVNQIPENLPLVDGDINRVQQILHNLIGNSAKFTNHGEISISASRNGSSVEVRVSDTGIGIPDDKQVLIWQSFQQLDASSDRQYAGTGLGLPITKQLVTLHGGDIRVESVVGEGSSFIFTLPVSSQSEKQGKERTTASVQISASEKDLSVTEPDAVISARILFADDEAVNHHVVESQLKGRGYSLRLTASGEDALKAIEEQQPDLVLLDIMMPLMDGYQVCRKIREKYTANEMPVIMITARNQVADLVEGLAAGANDFISKPYSGRELAARIETHLELKKNHAAFGKFVPRDLLKILAPRSGEPVEREMTVMMTSFSVDESIEGRDVYTFISSFLPEVLPVIRNNKGIIYRYEGEGVLSLFPGSSREALNASLEIHNLVDRFNRSRKNKSMLTVKSSLHEEKLLFGMAGDESFTGELLISGAIEQTVNLNHLGKMLNCSIVAGESAVEENREKNDQRVLALVYNNSTEDYARVHEIFPVESNSAQLKKASSSDYEEGLRLFYELQYDAASARFGKVLHMNPGDKAAETYRKRCLYYMNHPPEDNRVTIM